MVYSLIVNNIGEIFTADNKNSVLRGGRLLIAAGNDGKFLFIGSESDFIKTVPDYKSVYAGVLKNAGGRVVYPGFADSHTHIVFAATREDEFAMKARGMGYEEIAAKGGGILNSARKTANASFDEIYEQSRKRLAQSLKYGVTTIEIKSGYALTLEGELKLLRVIKKLRDEFPVEIIPTFLGAHAYPAEYKDNHDRYIDILNNEMLPAVKEENLAEFVDVFCEKGYFSLGETEQILKKALDLGFGIKLHADEFNSLGGTELASEMGAASVDHLETVTDTAILKMAKSGTVAGVLPITSVFSRLPFAPAKKMLDNGVTVALATDWNPGSSMCGFLPLAASLAATQLGFSVDDAIKGITINGAKSLRREKTKGSIEPGKDADFLIMDAVSYIYPLYHFAHNHVLNIFVRGREISC